MRRGVSDFSRSDPTRSAVAAGGAHGRFPYRTMPPCRHQGVAKKALLAPSRLLPNPPSDGFETEPWGRGPACVPGERDGGADPGGTFSHVEPVVLQPVRFGNGAFLPCRRTTPTSSPPLGPCPIAFSRSGAAGELGAPVPDFWPGTRGRSRMVLHDLFYPHFDDGHPCLGDSRGVGERGSLVVPRGRSIHVDHPLWRAVCAVGRLCLPRESPHPTVPLAPLSPRAHAHDWRRVTEPRTLRSAPRVNGIHRRGPQGPLSAKNSQGAFRMPVFVGIHRQDMSPLGPKARSQPHPEVDQRPTL